jgi:hypothetical protein
VCAPQVGKGFQALQREHGALQVDRSIGAATDPSAFCTLWLSARKGHTCGGALQKEHRSLLRTHDQLEVLFEQADAERAKLISYAREHNVPLADRSEGQRARSRSAARAAATSKLSTEAVAKAGAAPRTPPRAVHSMREDLLGSERPDAVGVLARKAESEGLQRQEAAQGEGGPTAADCDESRADEGRRKGTLALAPTSASTRCVRSRGERC